ncbi:hypothetical protein Adt_08828 [Abeliophyllum distichum]|uniref:Transmembrane protein n=1 Tax=Abeliophyllum distichum TaxID=126358 RepID=A0ABD1UFG4_9LAMI
MASNEPVKKIRQLLLLSVSVFSFIFSYSSLVYSLKFYLSAYPINIVTHALNKNCIFLLCNGLLVFLAKTSGLVHSRAGFDLNDLLQKKIGDGLQTMSHDHAKESLQTLLENAPTTMENHGEKSKNCEGEGREEDKKVYEESKSKEEEEISKLVAEKYSEEIEISNFVAENYNEEEEEENAECESTEELNKKFEDFIRRMKEEIKTTT